MNLVTWSSDGNDEEEEEEEKVEHESSHEHFHLSKVNCCSKVKVNVKLNH